MNFQSHARASRMNSMRRSMARFVAEYEHNSIPDPFEKMLESGLPRTPEEVHAKLQAMFPGAVVEMRREEDLPNELQQSLSRKKTKAVH